MLLKKDIETLKSYTSNELIEEMLELYNTTRMRYFGIAYTINSKYGTNYLSNDICTLLTGKDLKPKPTFKLTLEEEKELVRKYVEDNCSMEIVGIEYGIGKNESKRILDKHGAVRLVGTSTKYPVEYFDKIREMYKKDMVIADIAKELGVQRSTVVHLLNRMEIDRRTSIKHSIDENFFEKIDTQEKAYILGFLYADGCNYRKTNNMSVTLQLSIKDGHILEEIKKIMKFTGELYVTKLKGKPSNRNDSRDTNRYDTLTFRTYNKKISDDLLKIGMTPNKSFTKTMPKLDKELVRHFIRGYFDGNGSINLRASTNLPTISIISSRPMIKAIVTIFEKELKIKCRVYNRYDKNGIIDTLFVYGHEYNRKIREYFYKDSTISLNRKRVKFFMFK